MFHGTKRGTAPAGPGPATGRRRAAMAVESLEGRELLSHLGAGHHAAPAQVQVHAAQTTEGSTTIPGDLSVRRMNQPGPVKAEIGRGYAVKVPRFNTIYTGSFGYPPDPTDPKSSAQVLNGYLNAAGLKAQLHGNNLVLTGIIAGFIQTSPTNDIQSAFYNFTVNRGGATQPGPIPGRPRLTFDSIVTVGITPNGVFATVTTVEPNTLNVIDQTVLDPTSIKFVSTDAVRVTVPLSALPSTGADATNYRVAFAPSNSFPPNTLNDIASFLPEDNTIKVAVGRDFTGA